MWVLVTGGANRLGAVICETLASQGYDVVIHYNKSSNAALKVVEKCRSKGVNAEVIQGSFDHPDSVLDFSARYLQKFSETYALVNNVGDYLIESTLKTSREDWLKLFQLNLHTPFILCKEFAPFLTKAGGRIINLGVSGLLRHSGNIYSSAYTLSKESLWGLTRSLALELAGNKVTVNMVSPGMLDISVDYRPFLENLPMNRPGNSLEVARVIAFLLHPDNGYITGQNIEVAGGLGLK